VKIRENGVRYEVNFEEGHKTGFFCDQRENRRKVAQFAKDARVLDPPKFIFTRDTHGNWEGRQKYEDLNQLAIGLVKEGGIFVTCSCSGLLSLEDFEQHVIKAAHRLGRRLQFLDRTEAGPDHPVFSNCLESRYLKVLWARLA
jgi:23S rRNA (cytosine1962-C5)-methyltransferase